MKNIFKGKTNTALFVIRIIVGIIFLFHGLDKFNAGMDAIAGFFESVNIPAPMLMAWIVTLVETFGGLALILGLWTELAAGLLMVVMIVAIIAVKGTMGLVGGYELDLALIAGLIPSLVFGSGRYSFARVLDAMKPLPPQSTY